MRASACGLAARPFGEGAVDVGSSVSGNCPHMTIYDESASHLARDRAEGLCRNPGTPPPLIEFFFFWGGKLFNLGGLAGGEF